MKSSKEIIDKEALEKRRAKSDKKDNFLQKLAIQDIKDRLHIIKKRFETVGGTEDTCKYVSIKKPSR